jgi:hypothetical protein
MKASAPQLAKQFALPTRGGMSYGLYNICKRP